VNGDVNACQILMINNSKAETRLHIDMTMVHNLVDPKSLHDNDDEFQMDNSRSTALSILCFPAIILSLSAKYVRTKYSVCNRRYHFKTHAFLYMH
jgi:hypothetical protein